jgi:hypothetical protein
VQTLWGVIEDWLKPVVRAWRGPSAAGQRRGGASAQAPGKTAAQQTFTDPAAGQTLFDQPRAARPRRGGSVAHGAQPRAASADEASAQERYDAVTRKMLQHYGIRVRRWRKSMSGVAWEVRYTDGSTTRLIEAPRPKGPMSAAIFLHEIGHHAIGFNRYKPRCLEEYHAWAWSLKAMEEHGLAVTDAVRHRMAESLWYAVAKAQRRGIRALPPELMAFTTRPPRRRKPRGEA